MNRLLFASAICLLLLLAATTPLALANGGTVQVGNRPSGPYLITVFTNPNPIRVGVVDVSTLVQRPGSSDAVLDARVKVTAEPVDGSGQRATFDATHDQATNKLYYAANVNLPTDGRWRIGVQVVGAEGEGAVDFQVEATRESWLDNTLPLVGASVLPLLVAALFLSRMRKP